MHVSCEFIRSVDTQLCKMRVTFRAFSVTPPAIDYWPVAPLDATRVDETIVFIYRLDIQLISASTISCIETAVRT